MPLANSFIPFPPPPPPVELQYYYLFLRLGLFDWIGSLTKLPESLLFHDLAVVCTGFTDTMDQLLDLDAHYNCLSILATFFY